MFTLKRQIELESIFLISAVAVVSLFIAIRNNNHQPKLNIMSSVPAMTVSEEIPPVPSVSSQISSDGKKTVIMKVTKNKSGAQTYSFSASDTEGANEQFIFSRTLDITKNMSIPFNTWSPDNKYFFIQENAKEGNDVLVFNASGEPFVNETYLDATDLFNKKNTGNNFNEATGWASELLIVLNTTKPDNTKGPSYWFEVPSKAVIQLSTGF